MGKTRIGFLLMLLVGVLSACSRHSEESTLVPAQAIQEEPTSVPAVVRVSTETALFVFYEETDECRLGCYTLERWVHPKPIQDEFLREAFSSWCGVICYTLAEWWEEPNLVQDDRLRLALTIVYTYTDAWREHAQSAISAQIVWGTLDILGSYSHQKNVITVDDELYNEQLSITGAILAHEVAHAKRSLSGEFDHTRGGPCVLEEVIAFEWQAHAWEMTRLGTESSDLAHAFDALYNTWEPEHRENLIGYVTSMQAYQKNCDLQRVYQPGDYVDNHTVSLIFTKVRERIFKHIKILSLGFVKMPKTAGCDSVSL